MDKFVIRTPKTKRKSPESSATSSPPKKTKNPKNEEKKVEKSKEKQQKKVEKSVKNKEKVVEKVESAEEIEDKKMKNLLRTSGETKKETALGELLPTIKYSKNKVISDEDLEKLFIALCGDTGKRYDSDDSIISDIDRMDAEEIAAKDQKFRDNLKYLDEMPQTQKALEMMLRMGNETKEEKEERQKMMREMRDELKTKEEIDREEKKRIRQKERMEKMLKTVVKVFDVDAQKLRSLVEADKKNERTRLTSAPRLISCNQLSRFLEVMADLIPNEKGSEGEVDYRRQIKCIDSVEFDKRIESCGIRGDFYKEDKTTAEYLKKKVRKILLEPAILDVFDDNVFGFDFSTKDCINALENYFSLNAPDKDNGLTSKALHIKIHQFIRSCHHVARSQNPKFQLNERLKMALFD
ncbi:hypothetical protein GCK72_015305 [Caenorhabditis remanei]|uniref:Uncharacterized protein n=1 Tax=Caenorhabditis remanei TaxID=31234 RepID=A0A6A5GWH7_CAERE|nr:hypothetical protein GCK72_015305 [Caenorhabditis remanei]KAF1758845.1 hypothetical protein GCK72_015305 [Caenorhabditis remanei]